MTKIIVDEKKVDELLSRGVAEVISYDDLREKLLSGRQLRIKLGIDPTSPNIHLGRSVPLLKLRDFQELGHQIVLIIGNFTGTIGDTSDKEAERPMISQETLDENLVGYLDQASNILDMDKVEKRYNADWLSGLTYSEIGRQADVFSVADFIARDNIRRRLDAGKRVSLREMLYPLMQGYDSVEVRADVELGGTDQRFNTLAGRKLQPAYGQEPQNIVLGPLVEGLDGRKMSSSWGNTINLAETPRNMYGQLMSLSDELVVKYFKLLTRVPLEEVMELELGLSEGTIHPKDAKKHLAFTITQMYHGEEGAREGERYFADTFEKKRIPDDIKEVFVEQYTPLVEVLLQAELIKSKSEWRRLVAGGGATNLDTEEKILSNEAVADKPMTIRLGKRRFLKIELED